MSRTRRVLAVAAAITTLLNVDQGGTAVTAAAGGQLGLHEGPGDVAGMSEFSAWLGQSPTYASDYVDYRQTWNEIANPLWTLDTWSAWVRASSGRRLVFGVAMLPESARGQLAAGASGAFDGHFRTLAQNMVTRGLGSSVVRVGWEANGSWFPWAAAPDPASWRSYYRRIVQVMRSVPGAGFAFDWNPASSAAGTNLTFDAFYPGDDVVDIIGLNVYDLKWQDSTSSPEVRWDFTLNQFNGLRSHKTFADAHGKPLSFPEWGLYARGQINGGGGDNPYYVDRMADWFQANNTAYQSYFNADWGGGTLASFPEGQARYKARFGATGAPVTLSTTTTTLLSSSTTSVPSTTTTTLSERCAWLPQPYKSPCRAARWGD